MKSHGIIQTVNSRIAVHGCLALGAFALLISSTVSALPITDGLQVLLRAESGVSVGDGEAVLSWNDESGNGNHATYNASNGFGELAPVYDASNAGVADSATVRFNNQNALELNLGFLAGSDYTIFAVNGRDRSGLANFYLAGDSLAANSNLILGYEQPNLLRQAHFANDLDAAVEQYIGEEIWSIDAFRFNQSMGRDIFHNGSNLASDSNNLSLLSNTGTTLGHFRAFGSLFWFQGDLAEIAVYDRALSESEMLTVQNDLGERYGFAVTTVPEPTTFALFGLGLVGLGFARRKKA